MRAPRTLALRCVARASLEVGAGWLPNMHRGLESSQLLQVWYVVVVCAFCVFCVDRLISHGTTLSVVRARTHTVSLSLL